MTVHTASATGLRSRLAALFSTDTVIPDRGRGHHLPATLRAVAYLRILTRAPIQDIS
jgi:hypothetical protein